MTNNSDTFQIKLIEVDDAEPLAGELFQRSFNARIPDFPKHFVLQVDSQKGQTSTLGYVHFTPHHNIYLGGGMCVNSRALRKIPQPLRAQLNASGGVAFYMLSEAVKKLQDCDAVFGYVGHKGAYQIDLAVGFEQTSYKHLIVYWKSVLSQAEQQKIIQTAHQVGPF